MTDLYIYSHSVVVQIRRNQLNMCICRAVMQLMIPGQRWAWLLDHYSIGRSATFEWSETKAIPLFEPGVSGEDATGKSTERNLKKHALSFQVKSHLTDLNDHINGHMNDHDSKGFVMSVVREVLHSCSFFIYMYMMHLTAIVEIYREDDWITCERYFRIFCCCERKREKGLDAVQSLCFISMHCNDWVEQFVSFDGTITSNRAETIPW